MPGTRSSQQIPQQSAQAAAPRDWRTTQTTLPRAPEVGPQPPLRYEGGTLGFADESPEVYCGTPDGQIITDDLQTTLRKIDLFAEPDRSRILYIAGIHFGLDPWTMVDRNHQPAPHDQRTGEQQ